MIEHFTGMLKTKLRNHAAKSGPQWDQYLSGVLWTYHTVQHEVTGEKLLFLLMDVDCRTPTEAALGPVAVEDYCKRVILSLSTAV